MNLQILLRYFSRFQVIENTASNFEYKTARIDAGSYVMGSGPSGKNAVILQI